MTFSDQEIIVLTAFSSMAQADRPATRTALGADTGVSPAELNRCLDRLEALGLVDLQRLRLTLSGLCVAVSLQARHRRRGAHSAATASPGLTVRRRRVATGACDRPGWTQGRHPARRGAGASSRHCRPQGPSRVL